MVFVISQSTRALRMQPRVVLTSTRRNNPSAPENNLAILPKRHHHPLQVNKPRYRTFGLIEFNFQKCVNCYGC